MLSKISVSFLLLAIRCYQYLLSPLLGRCCRFYPSCSEYTKHVLQHQGLVPGLRLACRRFFRCHPFNKGGIDYPPNFGETTLTRGKHSHDRC